MFGMWQSKKVETTKFYPKCSSKNQSHC